jgi:hypothetical protein
MALSICASLAVNIISFLSLVCYKDEHRCLMLHEKREQLQFILLFKILTCKVSKYLTRI